VRRSAPKYDAIVIGSGMTGGWAAKELTEAGLRTLVLDAGRPIVPNKDYREHTPPWEMPFRGLGDRQTVARRQAVQRSSVTFDEMSHQFWVDDIDNPYSTPANKAFHWFRARQVGGKSIIWGRQVYRWSDLDFEANLRDGVGVDWPVRYADIAPWYDLVERFIGVSGQTEGLAHLPDGPFLPPMAMNCVETHVRDRMASKFGRDCVLTMGRAAILTQRHNGRAACPYCGPCHRGCVTRSYFSETREHTARVVFLCASALESARILLNSATPRHPDGLANSSGQVGRNVMDHIKWGGASGRFEGWSDRQTIGQRPNGIYVPRFRNVTTRHPTFIRGYGFQGGAGRAGWEGRARAPGIGLAFKESLTRPGPWMMSFAGFGEMLPKPNNRATLHPTLVDAWGIPTLHIECGWSDNELAIHRDMNVTAAELLDAAGAKDIRPDPRGPSTPGNTNHEMGTARMGRDPKTSVLNSWNQTWDVPNVFVTDGACMASSGNQNPSLTYMALTARACHYAVDALKRGDL